MRNSIAAASIAVFGLFPLGALGEDMRQTTLKYSDLSGWAKDNHAEALRVFLITCERLKSENWVSVCQDAKTTKNAKAFFETNFVPVLVEDGQDPLFTGYFEPELPGSREKTDTFRYPLYAYPPEAPKGKPWLTRAEIEGENKLTGRGLEIAWLSDPVETFFLHVQGSGRLRLPNGDAMRVGFAGKNGHKYRSVGKEMARRGLLAENKLSAGSIKNWVRNNPVDGRKVLWHNPSFVFFREIKDLPEGSGPIGAMSRPVTTMRTIAVDPEFTPLGAPVWVEKSGKNPLQRLMIAQDTGSAIKGAQRADIFYGSGDEAGDNAGSIRDAGRMVILWPKNNL